MRIHHLNCGTMCPLGGALIDGCSKGTSGRLVCHCLVIETDRDGLVMVDTGLGLNDIDNPGARLSPFLRGLLRLRLDAEDTAIHQVARLGYHPGDVRHIVLTHLDFDHAGGLDDFPDATIHVMAAEVDAARLRDGFIARRRYQPSQWHDSSAWRTYVTQGERWFGFDAVRALTGLPPEILMVPLTGHSHGHAGVAVQGDGGWLLHAGDAYFYRGEIDVQHPRCTPGLALYQRLMEVDRRARLENQVRLRDLIRRHGHEVAVMSAHDSKEFAAMS